MVADRQLLGRLRNQADTVIQELFERYYARIYRYLARLTGDPQVAADLAQDTFLKAFVALPRLSEDANVTAWLFQIATNTARSYYRRQRIIRWLPLDVFHAAPRDEEDQVVQRDLVAQALATLSLDYKSALLLNIWGGLSSAEIAETMGKSETSVRMMLVRARRQFRAAYEELGGTEPEDTV
jgi:RNA polymerase sigma-70 factor (ECF subfamily)